MVFGSVSVIALTPFVASISGDDGKGLVALAPLVLVTLLVAFAPSPRRAFGRGFLCLGAAIFLLPLSTLLLSGVAIHETVSAASTDAEAGGAAVGGVIAGGLMTGLAGLIGVFLGGLMLLCGLILSLGGRREVVVVRR